MTNQTQPLAQTGDIPAETLLPSDINLAMRTLVSLSEKLIHVAETETQLLIKNDVMGFAMLQKSKESLTNSYAGASREFRDRLQEFHGVDRSILSRLDVLQKDLGERMASNNVMVKRMRDRARENTQKTLLTVQELAQDKPVQFEPASSEMAQNSQGSL